jgi:WD40 repeat protein
LCISAAVGHSARAYDVRSKSLAWEVAHRFNVRDLDFNPNKSFQLALGADDGGVKFYDTRKAVNPVKTIEAIHTHWTWQVETSSKLLVLFLGKIQPCSRPAFSDIWW